jgi:hypothetical protein
MYIGNKLIICVIRGIRGLNCVFIPIAPCFCTNGENPFLQEGTE